ncbi:MFS transporter, partial [Escherichia coli]|nr:MFS transporter [Escherichia coli]
MNTQYNSSYIFSITLVATLGGLLFGYDTAVISGTVESLNTVFVAPQNLSESAAGNDSNLLIVFYVQIMPD